MKFDPNAATEGGNNFAPWPVGEYDFEVAEAEETTSKAGNDMTKLKLWVYDSGGNRRMLFDYLVASAVWKIKAFAETAGMLADFERGEMDAALMVGRVGKARLGIEKQEGFEERNKVLAYVKKPAAAAAPVLRRAAPVRQPVPAGADLDDKIPF